MNIKILGDDYEVKDYDFFVPTVGAIRTDGCREGYYFCLKQKIAMILFYQKDQIRVSICEIRIRKDVLYIDYKGRKDCGGRAKGFEECGPVSQNQYQLHVLYSAL